MKKNNRDTIINWSARAISIFFILFISIFALDVFSENEGFWKTTLAFVMHLIPAIVVLLILLLSWRREWIGGIAYILLAIFYLSSGKGYLLIAGPLFLMGVLFLIAWIQKKYFTVTS